MTTPLYYPAIERTRGQLLDSPIVRLQEPAGVVEGLLEPFPNRGTSWLKFIPSADAPFPGPVLISSRATAAKGLPAQILITADGNVPSSSRAGCRWFRPTPQPFSPDARACEADCISILSSWTGRFSFKAERREGQRVIERGLRPPQIGALYAALAHWTVTNDPATIVMPTGTGKTETMLGLLVSERLPRLLVIVPTDALRDQLSAKFLSLGILRAAGVVAPGALLPVVGTLRRKPTTSKEVDDFFLRCNVVVTTAQIAGSCVPEVLLRMATVCSHLFVDEAHHVRAPTWERIREAFAGKAVLQFTATPFRGDGRLVDGKVIYNYPLRKAQQDGYFRSIRFRPVEEYNDDDSDERIAKEAIAQLEEDLAAGHDHLLMARCANISRAEAVFKIYKRIAGTHAPVLAHSELPAEEKRRAVENLRGRNARIVVCVDMFGEGFDLPQLKVAALHDVHKSLAVTLQFTGRFTRTEENVGDATVVTNIGNADVGGALQDLYAEDPDWNLLLRELADEASGGQVLRSEFLQGFTKLPERIPLQNIFPKMSTVVFETQCSRWSPEVLEKFVRNLYDKPAIHPRKNVAVFVTKELLPVEWGNVRGICDTVYELHILHWQAAEELLYIHSSDKGTLHEDLAKAVCGSGVRAVSGERVFRVLHGVNRLILTNLGLGHSLSRAVRFTMHVGADIREGLTEVQAKNKYKTNVFGRGYSGGEKASIGCSKKGRIWSFRSAEDVHDWLEWCHELGPKLKDDTIDVGQLLKGAMVPTTVTARPNKVPITIEWSEDLLCRDEDAVQFEVANIRVPFYEVELGLIDHSDTGPVRFRISSDSWPQPVEFEVRFSADNVEYVPTNGSTDPKVVVGRRTMPLSEYLSAEAPVIRFHDGAFLIGNDLFDANVTARIPYDPTRIVTWPWTGVDLKVESQTQAKLPHSIQRHVIEHLLSITGPAQFDVVFDDDASGEAADIVALRVESNRLLVQLYHCKYSHEATAGKRLDDLYEVCGQAQRSVYWKGQPENLIEHLILRESKRISKGGVSRFERGDLRTLRRLKGQLRLVTCEFEIFVIQPGLSLSQVQAGQLDLLASTELYLRETYNAAFGVIASR